MANFAYALMIIAAGVTVAILFFGIFTMARGGEFNQRWSNKLMRYRIVAQGIAIAMFALAVYLLKNGG